MRDTSLHAGAVTGDPTRRTRVDLCVENICNQGCKAVWGQIAMLERGETVPETDGLLPTEISLVLDELKAVMACYKGSCSAD